jgi:RNA polymerase sigma factor (sigma-70 family)
LTFYSDIHREVIELSKAGNSKAQYQLYQLYAGAMYNVCFRMMNNREEAEDMLQESFTEAFRSLGAFRFDSTFGAWLKRITINKCINALKRRKANLVLMETLPERSVEDDSQSEIPGLSVERVQQAMEQLPEGYRVVFSLYLLEGYDHTEISQIMGISEATSKSQYSRARQRIQEILKQEQHGRQN